MPEEIISAAEPIPQTGEPTWAPGLEDDAEAVLNQPQPHGPRFIFFGRDGFRAGWSFLIYVVALFSLQALTYLLLRLVHLDAYAPVRNSAPVHPLTVLLYTHGIGFVCAILLAWGLSRVEHRRMEQYGLGSFARRGSQFFAGCLWGVGLMGALIAVLHFTHLLQFDGQLLYSAAAIKWGAIWAAVFLCVGLFEEYFSRGFLQFTLARGFAGFAGVAGMRERPRQVLGFWLAALIFSFLFGFGHISNPGESPVGLWSAGLIGLVFAFSLWRTGSLWWAVGWHAAWDWSESFVFGVKDSGNAIVHPLFATHPTGTPLLSGGLTGPEGSVYVLAAIAVAAVSVALTLPSEPGSPSDPEYTPNLDRLTR